MVLAAGGVGCVGEGVFVAFATATAGACDPAVAVLAAAAARASAAGVLSAAGDVAEGGDGVAAVASLRPALTTALVAEGGGVGGGVSLVRALLPLHPEPS